MRDIAKSLGGSGLTVAAGIMVVYGLVNLVLGAIILLLLGFAALVFGMWLILLFGGLYMAFGFGILDRHEWAYYGTLVLVPLALLSYLSSLAVSFVLDDLGMGILNFIHVMVHTGVLAVVAMNYKEFTWKPTVRAPPRAELEDDWKKGHRCENCKSENLTIFPDGSGRCNDCLRVFQNIRESSGGISD